MICAFACENDTFDVEIYRRLIELELGEPVERWSTDMVFTGWQSIRPQLPLFLRNARDAGIGRALIAIDNDGGTKRHLPHVPQHDLAEEAANKHGCRWCAAQSWVPADWPSGGGSAVIVVPVQTIDTWLLVLRDPSFAVGKSPEAVLHRDVLKKKLFGDVRAPGKRLDLARPLLDAPDARAILMLRPSYQLFAADVAAWRT